MDWPTRGESIITVFANARGARAQPCLSPRCRGCLGRHSFAIAPTVNSSGFTDPGSAEITEPERRTRPCSTRCSKMASRRLDSPPYRSVISARSNRRPRSGHRPCPSRPRVPRLVVIGVPRRTAVRRGTNRSPATRPICGETSVSSSRRPRAGSPLNTPDGARGSPVPSVRRIPRIGPRSRDKRSALASTRKTWCPAYSAMAAALARLIGGTPRRRRPRPGCPPRIACAGKGPRRRRPSPGHSPLKRLEASAGTVPISWCGSKGLESDRAGTS